MNPSTTAIIVNLSTEQFQLFIGTVNLWGAAVTGSIMALIFAVSWKG